MKDYTRLLLLLAVFATSNVCHADDLGDLESSLLGGDDGGDTKASSKTRKCPPFKDLPNVNRFSNETEEDTVVVFDCKKGYERVAGSTTRVCQASLKWSGTDLACKLVHCPKLTIPLAKPNSTNTVYGTAVAFSCKKGYLQVYGDVTRTCHANKTWSGRDIRCKSNTCVVPSAARDTICTKAWGTKVPVGKFFTCSCKPGLRIIAGTKRLKCVKMEQWSGKSLKCKRLHGFGKEEKAKLTNCTGFCQGCGDKILVPGGDLNGDGYADLICHKRSGRIHIALNDRRGGFQCQSNASKGVEDGWCRRDGHDEVYVADFDGDKRVDLMCHNHRTGHKDIRLRTPGDSYSDPKHDDQPGWCVNQRETELHVADFDGDGKADFMCTDNRKASKWFLKGRMPSLPYIGGKSVGPGWCVHQGSYHYIGDSNGDGSADIYCHDDLGRLWIINSVKINKKSNTAWKIQTSSQGKHIVRMSKFCPDDSKAHMPRFHLMDFDGDGTDDIYCHRTKTSQKNCVVLGKAGKYPSKKCRWESKKDYCNHHGDLLIFDKYFGTKRDDILCIRKGRFILIRNNGPK